jgi:hypothetical protein
MLVVVPMQDAGYSSASQTVSELSAIDAPTRSLWVSLGLVWGVLYAAFGWGVWKAAGENRRLRVAGGLIAAAAVFGLFWPPMHQREVLAAGGGTLTDTLHIAWTAVNGVLTLLAMGFGAAALGMRFRLYSITTMVILLAAGLLTSRDAPGVSANLPTPWIGVWERINIGVWLLWVVVLAVASCRRSCVADHGLRFARPNRAITSSTGFHGHGREVWPWGRSRYGVLIPRSRSSTRCTLHGCWRGVLALVEWPYYLGEAMPIMLAQ